jgi:hypothetical protein
LKVGTSASIAPWPFVPGAFAIVTHTPDGVHALVVDEQGDELMRTEPFASSPGGEVTPALAPTPHGLVVAMLNYGDAGPKTGQLEVVSLGPEGNVASELTFPTRRDSLQRGGVDVAVDGERVVVHWTETEVVTIPEEDALSTTRAMLLGCGS